MRPSSIVNFERIVLLSIAISVINLAVSWDRILTAFARYDVGGTFILVAHGVLLGLFLLLIWFVARRGSPIAKWIYVVIAAIGIAVDLSAYPAFLASGLDASSIFTILQDLLAAISLWLLFRPDASAWFKRGQDGDAAVADRQT